MTRLLCGSAGTLGIITRATFRIKAIPERCTAFCADGTLDACDAVATQVRCAKIEPVWAMAVPRALSSPAATWRLWVGFEGFSETVDFQLERLQERVGTQPLSAVQAADYDLYEGIAGPLFRSLADRPFVARIHCRSDRLLQTLAALPTALAEQVGMLDLLNGCIWAGMPGLESTDWQAACRAAADHQGHAVLMKADSEFKRHHDVFGMAQPAWTIMQRIKAVLDPHNVFCPGRMPGRA
jgi:FAD/FMN-containing dehydrogenase